ncbi:DUF2786 domain-containing protein [Nocardioides sp.]|uniref:DUF2786 domain-containing protein n=1 Tax=Nocardioides sp. TaxID=35761 RepID=UPI0039E5B148
MSTAHDGILRKVRALLAKAEDPATTPEESETYNRKAEELIARYAIEAVMLDARPGGDAKVQMRRFPAVKPYPKPKGTLLHQIATALGCQTIRIRETGEMHVYGYESDLTAVEILFASCLMQGTRDVMREWDGSTAFRTSFWQAFAYRVGQRLRASRRQAADDTPGAGIVLADRKQAVSDAFDADWAGNTRPTAASRTTSFGGILAGRAMGNRADLGETRLPGARRALSAGRS